MQERCIYGCTQADHWCTAWVTLQGVPAAGRDNVTYQAECAKEGSHEDSVPGLRSRLRVISHAAGIYTYAMALHG